MNLFEALNKFKIEMDRIHEPNYKNSSLPGDEATLINFNTASNGKYRHFSSKALELIDIITTQLHNNRRNKKTVDRGLYRNFVRQALADLHADETLKLIDTEEKQKIKVNLKEKVESDVDKRVSKITHHFPARTLGIENLGEFTIGPVTIQNKFDWINSIDFPDHIKQSFMCAAEENKVWKEKIIECLKNPHSTETLAPLGTFVYGAIDKSPALVNVTIDGQEQEYSYKLASLIAKTTLDSLSLLLPSSDYFFQQTLRSERLPPISDTKLMSRDGIFINLPGYSIGKQIPLISPSDVKKAVSKNQPYINAIEKIICSMADSNNSTHPELSNRWATALDWYAEGCRETSDAIAVAKLGASLDVLSCVGVFGGILSMTSHLLGIPESHVVFKGEPDITLKIAIERIYTSGRSQILHGSQYNRLKSFAETRKFAEKLGRSVLINAVLKLSTYTGEDENEAFRDM